MEILEKIIKDIAEAILGALIIIFMLFLFTIFTLTLITGKVDFITGQRVDVNPDEVALVVSENKNNEVEKLLYGGIHFLDRCVFRCKNILIMDISVQSVSEDFQLFIENTDISVDVSFNFVFLLNKSSIESFLSDKMFNVSYEVRKNEYYILEDKLYELYIKNVLNNEVQNFLNNYSFNDLQTDKVEIMDNLIEYINGRENLNYINILNVGI